MKARANFNKKVTVRKEIPGEDGKFSIKTTSSKRPSGKRSVRGLPLWLVMKKIRADGSFFFRLSEKAKAGKRCPPEGPANTAKVGVCFDMIEKGLN